MSLSEFCLSGRNSLNSCWNEWNIRFYVQNFRQFLPIFRTFISTKHFHNFTIKQIITKWHATQISLSKHHFFTPINSAIVARRCIHTQARAYIRVLAFGPLRAHVHGLCVWPISPHFARSPTDFESYWLLRSLKDTFIWQLFLIYLH